VRRTRAVVALGAVLLLGALVVDAGMGEAGVQLRAGAGRELTTARCIICHSLEYIPANAPAMDRAAWQKTVQKMRERFGAPIDEDEAHAILDYLSANYAGKTP
jgi:sulfite dehydrogenase (cytochrome) subunit B